MPLPRIVTPKYELELPSTGETVYYRPFLVKEEKLLVLALESEDMKEITTAIKSVLKNCIQSKGVKIEALPTFDIEYLFLNIRGKSVGEEVEVKLIAPDDGVTEVDVSIPIDEIRVEKNDNHTRQIKINEDLMMEMKYPSLNQFISNNMIANEKNQLEQSFDLIATCVDKIYSEEEVWAAADCSKKEIIEFLEQMDSTQFKQIETFFETMPKLSYTVKFKNPKTKKQNEVLLEGLSSFFA